MLKKLILILFISSIILKNIIVMNEITTNIPFLKKIFKLKDSLASIKFGIKKIFGKKENDKIYLGTKYFYKKHDLLSDGSCGKVYIGSVVKNKQLCVIKEINKQNWTKQQFDNECIIPLTMKYKHIVNIYDHFETETSFYIVFEYCDSDLYDLVQMNNLSEKKIKNIFMQVLLGVKYLHDNGWCHGDIKLENILISNNNVVKLCDFGFAKRPNKSGLVLSDAGTPEYVPPDMIIYDYYYGYKGDIWSLGVLLYLLIFNEYPFSDDNRRNIPRKIVNDNFVIPKKKNINYNQIDLIYKMLNKDPKKRPSIDEILNHDYFIENNKVN